MTNFEFVEKLEKIATDYKTTYVLGCFGAPLTSATVERYLNAYSYNRDNESRIRSLCDKGYFGFDCVCLIKAVLWGWRGDSSLSYGGAVYTSNGVGDISDSAMIAACSDVYTDFSNVEIGEAVWMPGHIGVYIGNGLAVECTAAWDKKVMITAVGNIGTKSGYNTRTWTKHGKLPYIEYVSPDECSRIVNAVNSPRWTDYLAVYTNGLSGTNKWGSEAQVNCYGKVINAPKYGDCNKSAPAGGFVLSGHGAASLWLLENVRQGYRVYRENGRATIGKLTDGKVGYIAGRDTIRLEDEIIVYTKVGSTGTNKWGCEVIVSGGVVQSSPAYGKCSLSVPAGGYVISGHGKGADWILANLKKGAKVDVSGQFVNVK